MRAEHRAAAAYELGVLDDAEEFETHLRGCLRCRELLAEFHPVSEALEAAVRLGYLPGGGSPGDAAPARERPGADRGHPPPGDGAARGAKPCGFSGRRGMATGALVLLALGVAVTAARAARPATARTWFASAASIVSPAQIVAGTGRDLRDPPRRAGFQ